jgi:hypothetical protein
MRSYRRRVAEPSAFMHLFASVFFLFVALYPASLFRGAE